ncbi:solute carrier family 15 member 2-like [Sipha flava]|uniref:Solute carrier family 15 member 2-like n=1 Tax=Sipha flava TaxID=143950 RepID=A0A8B8FZ25_9HEMI|nr:solute carrier family 15 member 2-like [Sipha flava]
MYFSSFMVLYSLVLVSIGMGGIKSCIAAFGVDQMIETDQNISATHVRVFFSTFYFSIHLGVFFGMFASPAITKILSYKGHNVNEYVVRFGLPAIMMTTSISVFVCGNSYYFFKKPVANVLPKMIECICNTTWIFQASRTSGRLFGVRFPVCMLQVVNPLLVLLTIPLMDRVVYPWLKTHGTFRYPLKRMLLGGGVAGVAFVFAGCVETRLENGAEKVRMSDDRRSVAWHARPCSANVWISNLGLQRLPEKECFVVDNVTIPIRVHEKSIKIQVADNENPKRKTKNNREIIRLRGKRNKNSIVLLVMGSKKSSFKGNYSSFNSRIVVLIPENVSRNFEKPKSSIYIIFPANNNDTRRLQIKSLTLKCKSSNMVAIFEKTLSTHLKSETLQIPKGLYTLMINYTDKNRQPKLINVLNLGTDQMFVYQSIQVCNNGKNTKYQTKTIVEPNVLSKEWLLPQFICMAFGETLFTMTGLAFSFSEAPDSMKTVSISMWYFSVALGNLFVIFINKTVLFEKKSYMFFMFAFNTLLAIIVTYRLSNAFEKLYYVDKKSDTEKAINEENVDLAMLLKKVSYRLSF